MRPSTAGSQLTPGTLIQARAGADETRLPAANTCRSADETVLQERGVPDPDRDRAGVLRPAADQPGRAARRSRPTTSSSRRSRPTRTRSRRSRSSTKNHTVDVSRDGRQRVLDRLPARTPRSRWSTRCERNDVQTEVEGTGGSSLLSMLTYILPFILFFGFWVFLMNQMQGGGSRVMSFGKSRAKRMSVDAPEDHLPRRRRRRRGGAGAARDQGVPREPEEVPGARRADPEGRAALRPARHRQDAARARRRRRGRACRSSRSRARTSSRCSSASAPAASATCSSRRSRTRPASSSWTRSTPSAATAAPAWAAATTSASRR